jgi:hypothetical protein
MGEDDVGVLEYAVNPSSRASFADGDALPIDR